MPPPSNYDDPSLLIQVNPNSLWSYATVDMVNEGQAIADAITAIVGIWNSLRLGWAGATADAVQAFSAKWAAAVEALFGTQADPNSGAFAMIANAVAQAAGNYAEAEDSNQKMFLKLSNSITSPSGTPPPPTRDQDQGPITETAPAPK